MLSMPTEGEDRPPSPPPPPPSPPPPEAGTDSELPGYTLRAQEEFAEQTYTLEDTKGRSWIWMKVKSRSKGEKQLPMFYDRDTIAGSVEVDFEKAGGAKAVTISVSLSHSTRDDT